MRDHLTYKRAAIRYWERRRIVYNMALVPPAFFSYMLCAGVFSVGDKTEVYYGFVLLMFGLYALGANLCYSFAYVLEFFFGSDDPDARWVRVARPAVFAAGLVFAIILALIGGRDVALLEFHHESKKMMSNQALEKTPVSALESASRFTWLARRVSAEGWA